MIVERVPTRSCVRRGSAIDLVLDRARENRSQLVFTRVRGGRPAIFWQTARTNKQARPGVATPTARASGLAELEIVVDSHERYAYTFKDQQVVTHRKGLPAGDYGVMLGDALLATVERKSLADLVSSLTTGKLKYQLAELAAVPRAAVVVEDRYSAAAHEHGGEQALRQLAAAQPLAPPEPTPAEVRAWAVARGIPVSDRGRVRREIVEAFRAARMDEAHTPQR